MSLNDLRDEAFQIAVSHGFTEATLLENAALIHSEVSEFVEDVRAGADPLGKWYEVKTVGTKLDDNSDPVPCMTVYRHASPGPHRKPCGIGSEIADIIIRCLHLAGSVGIDIEEEVREKMAYNNTRPFKHGKVI